MADADLVVSCTGATGTVIGVEQVLRATADRTTPYVMIDLALPRDVEDDVADLPGVMVLGLAALQEMLADEKGAADIDAVRDIVAGEVAAFLTARHAAKVTPTVVALRSMATGVVESEVERLEGRLRDVDPEVVAELRQTVRRVADKLLHQPTVRIKEMAGRPDALTYANALADLFALDPATIEAVRIGRHADLERRWAGMTLRVGTRASALATTQSAQVAERLSELTGIETALVTVSTEGDRNSRPLTEFGGQGVFVSALRDALLAGEVDVAVHSLKDLPTAAAEGIALAAVPTRVDPRDAVVARDGLTLGELPTGSRVGTGSPRRAAQLNALGLGIEVVGLRGNVDTRLGKVRTGELDAVVLAAAGLRRLGRIEEATELLDPLQVLPAPGQGALACECRADDSDVVGLLARLDDDATRAAVTAERSLLASLEAGCSAPVGAWAEVVDDDGTPQLWLRAFVGDPSGAPSIRLSATGSVQDPVGIGERLAAEMLAEGADSLMRAVVP